MKTNIKMRVTPEQSEKVQQICFNNGIQWGRSCFNKSNLDKPYIYIYNKEICYGIKKSFFIRHLNEEIDADLFIRTNGTYEEISDEGLSKIKAASEGKSTEYLQEKIINLHKQINKDRATIKNQKEELHKLNLKLQKCISLEDHDLKMKTVLNEKHKLEAENIEMGKLVNLNRSALDLAVMTKELAMNEIERKNNEIEKLKAVIELQNKHNEELNEIIKKYNSILG